MGLSNKVASKGNTKLALTLIPRTGSTEKNAFTNFLKNSTLLTEPLVSVCVEIECERGAWVSSGFAENLTKEVLEIYRLITKIHESAIQDITDMIIATTYGEADTSAKTINIGMGQHKQIPLPMRQKVEALWNKGEEHQHLYIEAIQPLIQQRKTATEEFAVSLRSFLTESIKNFEDFHRFMTADEYETQRQENRLLLHALSLHINTRNGNNSFFTEIINDLILKSIDKPDATILAKVLQEIELSSERRSGNGHDKDILDWARLLSHPSIGINIPLLCARIENTGLFPERLKSFYKNTIQFSLEEQAHQIRDALMNYREDKTIPTYKLKYNYHHALGKTRRDIKTDKTYSPAVIPPKVEYHMLIEGETRPNPGTLREFVEKAANGLAPNSKALLADLWTIIDTLRDAPRGLGANQIHHTQDSVYQRFNSVHLRHYHAGQRPSANSKLTEEAARNVIVVYYFDKKAGADAIVLKSIISHEDFDKRY